jgi:PleD family two-component response regulator
MGAQTEDLAKVKVLIVDGDYGTRRMIRSLLTTMGCACVHDVSDAASSFDAVTASRPDVVLLDWNMPGISGGDLVRRIRFAAMPRSIPIIMLAQPDERSGVPEAVRLGVHDFLLKPISGSALRARLLSALAKVHVERERPGEAGRMKRRAALHA